MKIDKYIRTDKRQRATKGEIVMNSLMPNRSYWSTWGWNNRLEQVQHLTNFVYVCADTICSLFGQHLPNLAYVEDNGDRPHGQHRKGWLDRRGNYVYDFRHRLVDSYDASKLILPSAKGWDGAALVGAHRHATQQYPGYRTYKALSSVQPHEELDPLSTDHPMRRLIVNPNRYDTSYDLQYELVLFLLLCGVSYLWAVPNGYGVPCELWVIPAHWVWPRGGQNQTVDPEYQHLVEWYEVRPFGAAGGGYGMVRIPADEIIAFTMKSPLSKIDGWSKLTACSQWIDISESMDRSAWAQMQNQGLPSMFIELGEAYKDADDNQTARIEAKFAQKLGGEYNTGRPFVGKPGMKMTPLNWSPESMMYPAMGETYQNRVLAVFHLSKIAVGMMENSTYGSILAGLAHTWIHCLNPLTAMIGQRYTKELAPRFADPMYRKWLKEGGQWLDSRNDNVLFSSMSKSGYVRDPSGKRRIGTDHEEEQGRVIRAWWPDGSPPDPQQVTSDIASDFTTAAITTNEIRAIRGRPPYELGGDNPLVQGPGGLMPLPLNVEEDTAGLGELVGAFTQAVSGGESGAGGVPLGAGEPEEVSEPAGLNPGIEEPNGKPSKGLRWVHRKEECTPGHTAARDGCTPAEGGGGVAVREQTAKIAEKVPSAKAQKAKAAHVMVNKDIQRYAEEHNEPRFAKVMDGHSLPDGEPVDVVTKSGDGVELKTMVKNGNDKITMDSYSQVRKTIWQQENGKDFHTVISDDRLVFNAKGKGKHDDSKRVYYYRRGVAGSARVQALYRCESEEELKKLMAMPEKELPPAARRTDAKLRVGKWKPFKDDQGKGFKNAKTGQVVRAKK